MAVLGHLLIIIREADDAKGNGDEQHQPDIADIQPRPHKGRGDQGAQNQNAAHCRRARFCLDMAFGAIITDRLAMLLLGTQQIDQRATKQKSKDQSGEECPSGTEGDIPEKVEKITAIREYGQPVQHYTTLLSKACSSALIAVTTRLTFDPFEPLTKITSSGATRLRAVSASALAVSTDAPRLSAGRAV